MITSEVHLGDTPRGAGLACALMYMKTQPDIYGWWIGRQGSELHTAYFRLADFYRTGTSMFVTSNSDLYGGRSIDLTSGKPKVLDEPLQVTDEISHALEQTQDASCGEWLVLPGDSDTKEQHHACAEAERAWSEVSFLFRQFNKFVKDQAVWRYYSDGFKTAIGEYLMRRWPPDYRG